MPVVGTAVTKVPSAFALRSTTACQRASSVAKAWVEGRSAIMALMICSYGMNSGSRDTRNRETGRTPVLAAEFVALAAKAAAAERFGQALPRPFWVHALVIGRGARAFRRGHAFRPTLDLEAAGGVLLSQPRGFVGKILVGKHRHRRHVQGRRDKRVHI